MKPIPIPKVKCPDCRTPMDVQERCNLDVISKVVCPVSPMDNRFIVFMCFCPRCVSYWVKEGRQDPYLFAPGIVTLADAIVAEATREINELLDQHCEPDEMMLLPYVVSVNEVE